MIYDIDLKPITDESKIDLSIGMIITKQIVKENVVPVDHKTKFFYGEEDLEDIQVYIIDEHKKMRKELELQPSQLDIIEAQITYTAIMTDTLLEV